MPRVLIVDDEAHVTRVIKLGLEGIDFEVETASNGEEALATFKRHTYDAVVTDVVMPRMTGLELAEAIRNQLGDDKTPIFLMTSRPEREFRIWAQKLSHVHFSEKPVSMRKLCAQLQRELGVDPEKEDA